MKTQIIQLEAHDDHISIRDKMNWSKTPRILLVLPRRRRFDLNTLDLKLLQRHARNMGAALGLVTKSAKVIRSAAVLGIPVFADNLEAQREAWTSMPRASRRRRKARQDLRALQSEFQPEEKKWRKHPLTRLAFFALGVFAFLLVIVAFVPSATITLHPEERVQNLTIPVRANANIAEVFLSGSIPAQSGRVEITESASTVASGRIAVPSQNARGTVTFRNLTEFPVDIPAGTVIRSITDDEIRFETMDDAQVAGGIESEVSVRVESLVFGERGNLDPDLLQAIEGELGLWLAATNPDPTSGGGDDFVPIPSERDRLFLAELALSSAVAKADEKMAAALNEGDLLFAEEAGKPQIIEMEYNPPEGEPGDHLNLKMQVAFEFQYVKEEDLAALAESALAASLPAGFRPVPNTLLFEPVSEFERNLLGLTLWQMHVERKIRPQFTLAQILRYTQGRHLEVAIVNLENNINLSETPEIEITPSWWDWLPVAPFRIELVVE